MGIVFPSPYPTQPPPPPTTTPPPLTPPPPPLQPLHPATAVTSAAAADIPPNLGCPRDALDIPPVGTRDQQYSLCAPGVVSLETLERSDKCASALLGKCSAAGVRRAHTMGTRSRKWPTVPHGSSLRWSPGLAIEEMAGWRRSIVGVAPVVQTVCLCDCPALGAPCFCAPPHVLLSRVSCAP